MKFLVIALVASVLTSIFIPQALASTQNTFVGTSSFERVPDKIVPNSTYEFEIKFQYTDSPYWLRGIYPVIEITPERAKPYVHIDVERIGIVPLFWRW